MTTVEVLRKAARRLERGRWCQGANLKTGGACCLVGAINFAAAGDYYAPMQLTKPAREAVSCIIGTANLVGWNDSPRRKKREVVAALRKAIALAEQEASS